MTDRSQQRRILEALVLAAPEPLPAAKLAGIVPGANAADVRELVAELNSAYEAEGRGFEVRDVAGGYQLRTRADLAEFVQQLSPRRPVRLSRASLETLAVVAYKQPITRAEIEHVRGVDAGAVVRSLLERDLVRIAGHREIPGRPMLYATTRRFLELFGLASLEELPTLRDLQELASADGAGVAAAPDDGAEGLAERGEGLAARGEDDDPDPGTFEAANALAALAAGDDDGDELRDDLDSPDDLDEQDALDEQDDLDEPEEPVGKPH
jgi:segregation and condensation protein B